MEVKLEFIAQQGNGVAAKGNFKSCLRALPALIQ